ncbi:MAG: AMP-binding protein [Bacteroidales bacterium]|nr:AMP-binding protein [Bacteroidales bacterium]
MNTTGSNNLEGVTNLPLILKNSGQHYPSNTALDSVDGTSYNYEELDLAARYIATMLQSSGMGKGDRIAILSENSPHWGIAYFGILTAGAITIPILPDFQGSEVISILEHAEAKSIIVSGKLISKLDARLPDSVELVINLDNFQVLDLEAGKISQPTGTPGQLHKLKVNPEMLTDQESLYKAEPDELAAIIYTSGTTGRSKGVMLTHNNMLSNARDVRTIHEVVQEDRFISILPLAHTYEFTLGFIVPLLNGATIHYIDRAPTASYLGPLLQKLAPTTMLTVPMIIEKIYRAKISPALSKSPLIRFLMKIGITRRLLSKAATRKLLKFFGGNLRFFGVGGAPLAPDVERFLIDGGFPYAIGYGLTETSPMLAGFGPSHAVYRSVGTVMEGITLKIDNPDPSTKEGEIVVKGSYVMKGYYKDEEKTKEVFTRDGFFRTGDLGYIDRKGILFIRGRLKNMILGPNGENIYPEEIEALINSKEIVSESLVMQYKGKLVARVHLKVEVLEDRFQHLKENATDFQQQLQAKADEVLDELLIQINQHVALNSRLQVMILQVQPFEKTPTHKIKRFLYK